MAEGRSMATAEAIAVKGEAHFRSFLEPRKRSEQAIARVIACLWQRCTAC